MKIEIEAVEGDRAQLYQWDLNRRLILTGFGQDTQAHFGQGDSAIVVAAYDDGGVLYADIPNICLQRAGMLYVYIYSPANTRTRTAAAFSVWARPKPEDYVYTETETLTYRKLEAKIGDLENLNTKDKSSLVSAVNEALKTSGGYGAVTYTEQNLTDAQQSQARKNIGALGTGALPDAINDALAQAKESGAFDGAPGKDGVDGKDGAPGADGQDGITPTIGDNGNWYIGTTDTGKSSRGQDGQPGSDGVGIQSVEQTTTSTDDGGTNIITVTKTDGTSSTFMVRNGSKGSTGATGKTGKTAYQYAQDGGYTGTEAEFVAKMAEEIPAVDATLTQGGQAADAKATGDAIRALSEEIDGKKQLSGTTDDLTPTQVYEAVSAGIPVNVKYTSGAYGLLSFTAFNIAETFNILVSQTIVYYNGVYVLAELHGNRVDNSWLFMSTSLAEKTDIPEIPGALPNPSALTFTGAVNGSYDGSAPLEVVIPSGGDSVGISGLPNWKLIKTLAFSTEVASITFSEDDNGDAFALKEIMIVGTVPTLTDYGYLFCGIGYGGNNSLWPTAGKEMRWWLASVNEVLKSMMAVSSTAVSVPIDKNTNCPSDIVQISIGASSGFSSDCTIYVYGR